MRAKTGALMVLAMASAAAWSAETNLLSFSYSASLPPDSAAPDPWTRKLNDGYWTNSASDGVRYNGDVAVTVDLGRRTRLERVELRTFTATGAAPLSTRGVSLECGNSGTSWVALGALTQTSNNLFSGSAFMANPRYLRLTCTKGSEAVGQSLAELVVAGRSASVSVPLDYAYSYSMPTHSAHPDYAFTKLTNGVWSSASTHSIQFGPSKMADVNPSNPTNGIASNVVVSVALDGVRTLQRAHLYAFRSTSNDGYGTGRVTLSNSLDGVTWTCAGQQTSYESLPTAVTRFDFLLPNVEARHLAFACEIIEGTSVPRQLLGELQLVESVPAPTVGAPLPFTYTFSKAPAVHVDKAECPKLTDGAWNSNTRNAVRVYGDVAITADLGAPRYVAGMDLLCWSNRFTAAPDTGFVYGTGRVVVYGGLETNTMSQLAEITSWSAQFPYRHAVTFTNLPYARYLRFDTFLCENTESSTNTAQLFGELTIYRPPAAVVGALPEEASGAIPNAGFESPEIPTGDAASMLLKGGPADGWTFSYANAANYAGCQRNNSTVSTNHNTFGARYFAPGGVQTAVLMGSGSMETQLSVPTNGTYTLQMQVNSTVISSTTENGGYDFRVRLDGAEQGLVTVRQLTNTQHEVFLHDLSAGAHTLRLEGVNSRSVTWGALIDNLSLKRFALSAGHVPEQGRGFVFMADSATPLALDYSGTLIVKELWLDGVLVPPSKYSALTDPSVFEGPGAVRYDRGTLMLVN